MKICDYFNIAASNAEGYSKFEIYKGQTGQYQYGNLKHSEFKHFNSFGVIDTETMTMPVRVSREPEYNHIDYVLEKIAMAVLNNLVERPNTKPACTQFLRAKTGKRGRWIHMGHHVDKSSKGYPTV